MTLRNKTSPDRRSRALECAAHGWRVFPVLHGVNNGTCMCDRGESCSHSGKHPRPCKGGKYRFTDSHFHTRSETKMQRAQMKGNDQCSNADLSKWAILTRNSANE